MKLIKLFFVVLFLLGATSALYAQVLDHFHIEDVGGGNVSTHTAGLPFAIKITAKDAANATVETFIGTVNFSTVTGGTISPAVSGNFVAGVLTSTSVTLTQAGLLKTITVTEVGGASITNASNTFTVNPGPFSKLQLLVPGEVADPGSVDGKTFAAPSAQAAGTPFTVTVNAVDANWNVAGSSHNVGITSNNAYATLPSNNTLALGTQTFSVTLNAATNTTLTATDITDGSKTANTSPAITVNPGAFAKLQLLVPGETAAPGSNTGKTGTPSVQIAGTLFPVTVNAVDAKWNLVTSVDDVGITTSDPNDTHPLPALLVGGTQSFNVTLVTAGTSTITATDITDPTKTANTSPAITVNPGVATKYIVTSNNYSPAASGSVTISAQLSDANNNSVSTAGNAVTFALILANGTLGVPNPGTTDLNGIATVTYTASATGGLGTQVTATTGGLTGTSSAITAKLNILPADYTVGVSVLPTFTWFGGANKVIKISTSKTVWAPPSLVYTSPSVASGYQLLYTDIILTNNTVYYWSVDNGTTSNEFKSVNAAKPNINPIYPGVNSAYVGWFPVPYSSGLKYDLVCSTTANMLNPIVTTGSTGLTNTYYTITGLEQATNYYVQIRATNSNGTVIISYSNVYGPFQVDTPPVPNPSYPTDPVADGSIYANPPTLFWWIEGNEPGLDYQIEVQPLLTPFTNVPTITSTANKTFKANPTALTAGASYHWQVRSKSGAAISGWSTAGTFTMYTNVASAAIVPTPSWPVANPTLYLNPPALYWYIGADVTGLEFNAEISTTGTEGLGAGTGYNGGGAVANDGLWTTDLFKVLPATLLTGQRYYWHVRSRLIGQPGTESNYSTVPSASFTIALTASGDAVTPVPTYPIAGIILDGALTDITLNWVANSSQPLEFLVRMATGSSVDGSGVLNHGSARTSPLGWVPTLTSANAAVAWGVALTPGATYYWQVRTRIVGTNLISPWSMVANFATAAGSSAVVPIVISPNYGQPINNTSAILTWEIPVPTDSHLKYDLQYSKNADFIGAQTKTNINEPRAVISGLEPKATYYWRVKSSNDNGSISNYSAEGNFKTSGATAVEDKEIIPTQFELSQNYPNPFNPTTIISYSLPQNAFVNIKVYDMLGREVRSLVNNEMMAGKHSIEWNGVDNTGSKVASGAYIYRITAGNFISTKKMLLLK